MVDSTVTVQFDNRLDSLQNLIENSQISTTYYQNILDHQWALLQAQTAIFVGIIIIILTVFSFIAWRAYFYKLSKKINDIEKNFERLNNAIEKVERIENQVKIVNTHAHRSLYETAKNPVWKVIWHIRYCEVLFDRELYNALSIRLKELDAEFSILHSDQNQFQEFLKFENLGGIKDILKKLINYKEDTISTTPSRILDRILSKN